MTSYLNEIVEEIRRHPRLIVVDDFEVVVQRSRHAARDYSGGQATRERSDDRVWVALRLLHRRQPGRASTETLSAEGLNELVETAYEAAQRSSVDPWFRFPLWKPSPPAPTPAVTGPGPMDSLFPKLEVVPTVFEESYGHWDLETLLHRKTEKHQLQHRRQVHQLRFAILGRAGEDYFWLREERAAGRPLTEREDWLESLLMQSVALAEGNRFAFDGPHDVLAGPAVGAALVRAMAPWFHADSVHSGYSPLTGRSGPLLAPVISLVDDGAHPDGPYSAPFDMEGAATQRTRLVDEGRLADWLHDASTAARDNRISTGNFLKASEGGPPRIQASQLAVEPSRVRPSDLCQAMSEGVILQSLDGFEPLPNEPTRFRLVASGWRVEGGSCAEPLRGISLEFDILSLFERAVEVGSDLAFYGNCGAPSILFENVPLGRS